MNKQTEFNKLKQQMSEVNLPTIDFSGVIMKHIRMIGNEHRAVTKPRFSFKNRRTIWLTAVAVFLVLSATVSASVLPLIWNGMSISIEDDGGKNSRIDAFKELIFGKAPTYKEIIEDVVHNGKNAKEVLTLIDASNRFPFTILRPDSYLQQLKSSNGVLMNEYSQENGKDLGVVGYRPVFHDIYELDHHRWAIVSQSLNEVATEYLHGNLDSISSIYSSRWENVVINERVIVMYAESKNEKTLNIEYKTNQSQVINLIIIGNVSKDELLKLAEAYIGKIE